MSRFRDFQEASAMPSASQWGGACRHLRNDWLHGKVKRPWACEALGSPPLGGHFFWVQQYPHILFSMLPGCPMHMEDIKDTCMLALSSRGPRKTVSVLLWSGSRKQKLSCLRTAAPAARCGPDLRSLYLGKGCDGHLPGQPPIFV